LLNTTTSSTSSQNQTRTLCPLTVATTTRSCLISLKSSYTNYYTRNLRKNLKLLSSTCSRTLTRALLFLVKLCTRPLYSLLRNLVVVCASALTTGSLTSLRKRTVTCYSLLTRRSLALTRQRSIQSSIYSKLSTKFE